MSYYAVPKDKLDAYTAYWDAYIDAFLSGGEVPVPEDPHWASGYETGVVFGVYGIDGGRGEAELKAALKEFNGIDEDSYALLEEIAQKGDTRFYLAQYKKPEQEKESYAENMGELYPEYVSLLESKDCFLGALTLSEPKKFKTAGIGDLIAFDAAYLDGTPVSSAELFKDHDVTMINLWATWCGPCVGEMPELAKLSDELEAKNCQIIGICLDAGEEGMAQQAQDVLDSAGASYANLIAPANIDEILPVNSIPTSFFVDSEGRILLNPVIGAYTDQYPVSIDEALDLIAASRPVAEPAAAVPAPAAEEAAVEQALPAPAAEAVPEATEEAAPATETAPAVDAPAPAEEPAPNVEGPVEQGGNRVELPALGVSMVLPESFDTLNGTLSLAGIDLSGDGSILEMEFDYNALPMARYEALYNALFTAKQALPEEISEYLGNNVRIFSVFFVRDGKDFDALAKTYEDYYDMALRDEQVEKIALSDGCSYYLYPHYAIDGKTLPDGLYADELKLVTDSVDGIVNSMAFQAPLA